MVSMAMLNPQRNRGLPQLPGLSHSLPPASLWKYWWEWPKTTTLTSSFSTRGTSSRLWVTKNVTPSMVNVRWYGSSRVQEPQSLFPRTAQRGPMSSSSSSRDSRSKSPAWMI